MFIACIKLVSSDVLATEMMKCSPGCSISQNRKDQFGLLLYRLVGGQQG